MRKMTMQGLVIAALAAAVPSAGRASDAEGSPILQLPGRPFPEEAHAEAPAGEALPRDPAARALFKLKEPSRAGGLSLELPAVEGIIAIAPEEVVAVDSLDLRIEQIRVGEAVRRSRELQQEGRDNLAIELLERTLKAMTQEGSRADLYHQLGVVYTFAGEGEKAAECLERVRAMRPDDFRVANNLAGILLGLGEVDRAFVALESIDTRRLLEEKANDLLFSVHFNYACGYSLRKKAEEALAHLDLAAQFSPRRTMSSLGDPNLDLIRRDPRFEEMRKRLEAEAPSVKP